MNTLGYFQDKNKVAPLSQLGDEIKDLVYDQTKNWYIPPHIKDVYFYRANPMAGLNQYSLSEDYLSALKEAINKVKEKYQCKIYLRDYKFCKDSRSFSFEIQTDYSIAEAMRIKEKEIELEQKKKNAYFNL